MDKLNNRVTTLEDRADKADSDRQEIETRLLVKLDALEQVGQDQVGAIRALTAEIKSQAARNEMQDQDLERIKEIVHGWMGEEWRRNAGKAVGGVATVTTVIWALLEFAIRYLGSVQ